MSSKYILLPFSSSTVPTVAQPVKTSGSARTAKHAFAKFFLFIKILRINLVLLTIKFTTKVLVMSNIFLFLPFFEKLNLFNQNQFVFGEVTRGQIVRQVILEKFECNIFVAVKMPKDNSAYAIIFDKR